MSAPLSFGLHPFGTGAFAGPGQIEVLGAYAVARNEVLAFTNVAPRADDPEGWDSATNPRNWALATLDPTVTSGGLSAVPEPTPGAVPTRFPSIVQVDLDDDEETTLHLFTDVPLELRVRYRLSVVMMVGSTGQTFVGPTDFLFRGLAPQRALARGVREPLEPYRDLDTSRAGAFRFEPSGDIGVHAGNESLKKRVYRRILTDPGGFAHLPRYGAGLRVKAAMRNGTLQELANNLAEQIRREPDVAAASVTLDVDRELGIVEIRAFVQRVEDTRTPQKVHEFRFDQPL